MCVVMVTIIVKLLLPWQPSQDIFTSYRDENIKFQNHILQSSKSQNYWDRFTLVNNSLVSHQLLVTHV